MFLYSYKICYSSIIYTLVNEILGYIQNIIVLDIVEIYHNWLSVSQSYDLRALTEKKQQKGEKGDKNFSTTKAWFIAKH